MLPTQVVIYPSLFQAWQPSTSPDHPSPEGSSDYIELPSVSSYQALEQHEAFLAIQTQFLADIHKLRQLAHNFVNQQYDNGIDFFHDRLKAPPEHLQNYLLPIYRDTRFQIHQLVMALENHQHASTDQQAYIASQLHDCLSDIDRCLAGVHSRFAVSFINFAADQAGLAGKLFQVRQQLFHECIASFLFVQQRKGLLDIPSAMAVHWFNSLHNLYCDALALLPIADPGAPTRMSDGIIARFLAAVDLSVNACTILRKFSDQWADLLSTTLHDLGIAAWETDTIPPSEMTADRTVTLDSKLFKPVNHLLQTTGEKALDLWNVVEENGDGSYRLDRYREKILAWMSIHFCGPAATVFAAIPGATGGQPCLYIGTISKLFFWVFAHSRSLCAGQPCTYDTDNHTTLTLAHLTTLDFATWPENISHALLTQAMEQTDNVEDIAAFFLHRDISAQLKITPQQMVQALSSQLNRKLAHHRGDFQKRLCRCICNRLAGQTLVSSRALHWLMDTPLLESVLSAMHNQKGLDIRPLTQHLATWHISGFTQNNLNTLLTSTDCKRLFWQALELSQDQTLSGLMLTGHCDQLCLGLNGGNINLLAFFAGKGTLPALNYLLTFPVTNVNREDPRTGMLPLACAAQYGNVDCLKALLAVKGILVNLKNPEGRTPLHFAVDGGATDCVKALLRAEGIQVNARTHSGWTAVDLAARHGHAQCLEALLESSASRVNDKNSHGYPPISSAAREGHADCIKVLLGVEGILVNIETDGGWTPLLCAIISGHTECVRVLLTSASIEANSVASAGTSPLCCAARYDRADCIEALLEKKMGIDVNLRDRDEFSPLDHSALGHAECIRALLAAPDCRVNDRNPDGNTPLCSAAENGYEACVRALLSAETIQVNATTDTGWTAFDLAVKNDHPECLKALLATGCIDINRKNPDNFTALATAAIWGHTACVKVLVNTDGIDINLKSEGWTPLHLAAKHGNLECLTALLASDGIVVNSEVQPGWTALSLADRYRHAGCVRALLARYIDPNTQPHCSVPLHYAARFGDADWVRTLTTTNNELVNARDFQDCTPLHYAAIAGHAQCIEALLATGVCHVNLENPNGYTALSTAACLGHTACIRVLLSADCIDANLKDRHDRTPLDYAACKGHADCVRILLDVPGIAVNVENNDWMTPLLYAATYGRSACVEALLRADSIEVNKRNTIGWTPLCAANRFGHSNCVKALLEANDIDVNAGTGRGCTPLHFAAGNGHTDCLKLLLDIDGIGVNLKTDLGDTPLDLAFESGHTECIQALTTAGGIQAREQPPE